MLEMLILAGLTGLCIGALMLGRIIAQMKAVISSSSALHDRLDMLIMALVGKGLIDAETMADMLRRVPRGGPISEK